MDPPAARRVQNNRRSGEPSNHRSLRAGAAELQASQRACREIARSRRENFVVASVLLPRPMRQHFFNIYAFCRTADDLADRSCSPEIALRDLEMLQRQLDATFRGQPPEGILVALSDTVERFELPQKPLDDLLEAFRQDQHRRRYASFDQLLRYCEHSANPVGRIILALGACDRAENVRFSDQICTGLQLANFCQDVAADYALDRIYLPSDEMERHGVTAEMLAGHSAPPPLRRLLAEQCDRADEFLRSGLPLARHVPPWLAADVALFAHGGLATLEAIRRSDFDVLRRRPTVSRWRRAVLVARAVVGWL